MRWLNSSVIAAAALVSLAAALPASTAAAATERPAAVAAAAAVRHAYVPGSTVGHGGEVHGIALTEANRPFAVDLSDVSRLAADGVNTVDLYITEYQANAYANDVYDGKDTPTAGEVEAAVRLAHQNGIAVELMPIVWTAGTYAWRGEYVPGDIGHWFHSYQSMIDRWAAVAQTSGAELFAAGTEYEALQAQTARWRHVVASVRRIYHGTVTYMATAGSFDRVRFWDAVDEIGISPYFTLSAAAVPTVASLKKAWQQVLPAIHAFSKRWHRPVLFDELGYESIEGAAFHPFAHPGGTPSEKAQANAYQAAIDVTHGLSWLRGVVFFTWGMPEVPTVDTSYDPGGKLAECVMARSWASASDEVAGVPPICPVAQAGALG